MFQVSLSSFLIILLPFPHFSLSNMQIVKYLYVFIFPRHFSTSRKPNELKGTEQTCWPNLKVVDKLQGHMIALEIKEVSLLKKVKDLLKHSIKLLENEKKRLEEVKALK